MMIIKIVVKTKVLLIVQTVVKPHRKLIATLRLYWRGHKFVAAIRWKRNILQKVNCGGIKTAERNDVVLPGCQDSKDTIVSSCVIRESGVRNSVAKSNTRLVQDVLGTTGALLERKRA